MSLLNKAVSGAGWLSAFKLISQIISWSATLVVTRLLSSEDYGLMEMATVFTGYISFFVEFGISAALVNRDTVNQKELSSTFWLMFIWGILLSLLCLILAPLTVQQFNEPRLLHLTQAAGFLFILSSLIIVPRSIMQREMRFKEIGIIEIITIIISSIVMISLAANKFGPWTLIGGFIGREITTTTMLFIRSRFIPSFTFSFKLITPFLHFGAPLMLSTSLYYIYTKADRFFGGKEFGAEELGYYALALQLAAIPVEKIVSLLQSVLFPTLSKLKYDKESFNEVYLVFVSFLGLITFPLFVGGILVAKELVLVIMGEKWLPAVLPLQILLAAQIVLAISAPNGLIHAARGKPKWNLLFNLILTPVLVTSFYYSSKLDQLYQLALPWIVIYPIFQFTYILITNRELDISLIRYIKSIYLPIIACLIMCISILCLKGLLSLDQSNPIYLSSIIAVGAASYLCFFLTLGKSFIKNLKDFKNRDY